METDADFLGAGARPGRNLRVGQILVAAKLQDVALPVVEPGHRDGNLFQGLRADLGLQRIVGAGREIFDLGATAQSAAPRP